MNEFLDVPSFLVSRLQARLKDVFSKRLIQFRVTPEQWVMLARMSETEGTLHKELTELSLRDKAYTTILLARLEEEKYIFKEKNLEDKRSAMIYLTKEGARVKEEIAPIVKEINHILLQGFKENEIDQAKIILKKMFDNIYNFHKHF